MNTRLTFLTRRSLNLALVLLVGASLAGCNGTVSSVSFPAASPWNQISTGLLSPTDDLVAVASGAGVSADLFPGGFGEQAFVACGGAAPYLATCSDRACDAQATCGADPVIEKRYAYTLFASLDRGIFSAGGVEIQDGSGATRMGLSINAGATGGEFDVAAGFSEGLIPGVQFSEVDEVGTLFLFPHWPAYGSGEITGQICPGGVCSTGVIAECSSELEFDILLYATAATPGTYSGTCGTVPVNLTINPVFSSVGQCISTLKATRCGGLKGQAKATCNHAQIGVCHATFNVPSSHNPS